MANTLPTVEKVPRTNDGACVVCKLMAPDDKEPRYVRVVYSSGVNLDKIRYLKDFKMGKIIGRGQCKLSFERDFTPLSKEDRAAVAKYWQIEDPKLNERPQSGPPPQPSLRPLEYNL